jgi:hypothetical protein
MRHIDQKYLSFVLLAALLVTFAQSPAFGQKKKKDVPVVAPTQAEMQSHSSKGNATIREILTKLQGQQTNLGILTKVSGDFVTFDNDGDTLMYPLNALQHIRLAKPEEDGEARKIEIRFFSKD